ncbi:MAG: elongation factor G [Dehalococcoidia bacterium]|nr:elongation factor G [Dehalococcoidia bacterium]
MPQYTTEQIRNVVLLSHSGAGKTALSEAMLYSTGAITRLGKVDQGNTTSDYDPDEVKRKSSIYLSLVPCEWQGMKVNIMDTPGYADFIGEVTAAVRVADSAVIVVCAASGVEVGTELSWGYSDEQKIPRLVFVNKIDRENADFLKVLEELQAHFGKMCLPIELPIGAQQNFTGVIDLITMKTYSQDQEGEIPDSLRGQAEEFRDKLVEAVAETDDDLIAKYLEGEALTEEEIRRGLRVATVSGHVVPVLVGSALENLGTTRLLDSISQYLPSPKDRDPISVTNTQTKQDETIEPDPTAPLAALVFKTSADPYVGKLTYFRVFSGTINSDSIAWNATRNSQERVAQLFMIRGKVQEPVPYLIAGDIGAVAKLAETSTGDTLCGKDHPLALPAIAFPLPTMSVAVHPKTKADLDKLGSSLSRIAEEDPSLHVRRDADTAETILSGMGEAQLEVVAEKMQRKFGVDVLIEIPKIPYKETITVPIRAEYKHKKQTGGHGQYGHVFLELEPLPRGTGNEFSSRIVGGSVPKNYFPAVEKGVFEALKEGVLAKQPVVDVKVTLYDGTFHAVDSSEMAFKIASSHATKNGLSDGHPVLLEPIMMMRITVPESFTGDIMGDLNSKRAKVMGMTPQGGWSVIEARAPLSEVQRYAIDMRSITQGKGSFQMELSHYEEVPAHITQRITAEGEKEKGDKA